MLVFILRAMWSHYCNEGQEKSKPQNLRTACGKAFTVLWWNGGRIENHWEPPYITGVLGQPPPLLPSGPGPRSCQLLHPVDNSAELLLCPPQKLNNGPWGLGTCSPQRNVYFPKVVKVYGGASVAADNECESVRDHLTLGVDQENETAI